MDLGDALYRAICRRSPATEPATFGQAVAWFLGSAGGNVTRAAADAGVPRRTFRDWVAGVRPRDPSRAAQLVGAAVRGERRRRLRPGRERRLRALDPTGIKLRDATYMYDGSYRDPVNIGQYLSPDVMGRLLDAFLDGSSPERLRQGFARAAEGDATGFYPETLALPPSDEHGWDIGSVEFDGGED